MQYTTWCLHFTDLTAEATIILCYYLYHLKHLLATMQFTRKAAGCLAVAAHLTLEEINVKYVKVLEARTNQALKCALSVAAQVLAKVNNVIE